MKHARHFENTSRTAVREAACIGNMIADMRRIVEILDCDVSTEEKSSQICDRSDARYPILARQLAARRDNLRVTIAALEARLGSAQPGSQN
jgi:septation ring formation regulator EzrA